MTYNLFLTQGSGFLTGVPKPLDAGSMPLFRHLHRMLATPLIFPRGGFLGVYLAHSYPHTHDRLHQFVPSMLKAGDMALYESIAALGLVAALDQITGTNIPSRGVLEALDELYKKNVRDSQHQKFVCRLQKHEIDPHEDEFAIDEDDEVDMMDHINSEEEEYSDYDSEDARMNMGERAWNLKQRLKSRQKISWLGEARYREMSRTFLIGSNIAIQRSDTCLLTSMGSMATTRSSESRTLPLL